MAVSPIYAIPATTALGVSTTVGALCAGKVALIVNTASACGFTPQLEGLQALYQAFGSEKFTVLAYPCNQFGAQEPGDIKAVESGYCARFKTTFPVMNKCDVNGDGADPLWTYLKEKKSGFLGFSGIKWNFTKFLIDSRGNVVERELFSSLLAPRS